MGLQLKKEKFSFALALTIFCCSLTAFAQDLSGPLRRCDITAEQNKTGSVVIYSKAVKKKTIVENTVAKLNDVDFRFGHAYTNPWVSFKNGNKYGVYALALGFFEQGTLSKCSRNPKDYQAVLFCRGLLPGIGVGAGESGRLECSMKAKAATEHDFCIIGFTPEFESTDAGLANAMDVLGMCD